MTVGHSKNTWSFRKYLINILGKHDIKKLRKAAILGAANVLREEEILKYTTFVMGNSLILHIAVQWTYIKKCIYQRLAYIQIYMRLL
jgi:hypothetical protein